MMILYGEKSYISSFVEGVKMNEYKQLKKLKAWELCHSPELSVVSMDISNFFKQMMHSEGKLVLICNTFMWLV